MDDDAFDDDGFEEILSQAPIDIICKPTKQQVTKKDDENKFKKPAEPKYSFNKLLEKKLSQSIQNSQLTSSNNVKKETFNKFNQQQNQFNQQENKQQIKPNQQQNKSNQQQNKFNQQQNQQQNKSNQQQNKSNVSNQTFAKPQVPVQKPINNNQSNLNSNLAKSVKAQASNQSKYSINKQNLSQLNRSTQPSQLTKNKLISSATSSLASSNQTNSTITDFSVVLSTQVSSQSICSQFSISDNVPSKLTVDPSIKTIDHGIDPKDKYIGKIRLLEKSNNKLKEDIEKAYQESKNKDKIIEELKGIVKRKDEDIKTIKAFKDQEKTAKEFKETVLNTTIDNDSFINQSNSAKQLQFKKQSPKPSLCNRSLTNQFSQSLNFQNDTSLQINDLNFESDMDDNMSDDSSVVGPTQVENKSPQIKSNELNSKNSNESINIKNENKSIEINYNDDVILPPTQQTQSTDEIIIPETQQPETVKEENEMEIEIEIEGKEIVESRDEINDKTNIKRIKTSPESEVAKDEIMNQLDNDDAIFHHPNFKFTDFVVYDYLEEKGEINLVKDNLNPYFDQILDRINILEKISKKERLRELDLLKDEIKRKEAKEKLKELNIFNLIIGHEFNSFSKLNDVLILKFLFDFQFESLIPEYTFNLLTNLTKYNDYLENKNIIYELTNKCLIRNSNDNNRFQSGNTFLNRILYYLSSFNEIRPDQTKYYQRLCYSIIQFLIQNTVENNNIKEFHKFELDKEEITRCVCWRELYNVLGEFALYILEQFDIDDKLHYLIVKDLTKFTINLNRTNFQKNNSIGIARFTYFAQKMSLKLKCIYLDYLN